MPDRYEQEIDELLIRLEGRVRRPPATRRLARRLAPIAAGSRAALAGFLRRSPAEQFMIAGMVLIVISYAAGFVGFGRFASFTSLFGLLCMVLGIALSLIQRRSPGYGKRWRGRDIYLPSCSLVSSTNHEQSSRSRCITDSGP